MKILENISLKDKTTFAIGGLAKYYVVVEDINSLREAIKFADNNNCKHYVLAGGSNILFSDNGFDGLIIQIGLSDIDVENNVFRVGAGVSLSCLVKDAKEKNLSGLEEFIGIPGTVGGAVRGNAGAFGSDMEQVVDEVSVYDKKTSEIFTLNKKECNFDYRNSIFKSNENYLVLDASFKLSQKNKNDIADKMYEYLSRRIKNGLQDIKSAGSFFMNPQVSEELQDLFYKDKGIKSKDGRVPAGWLLDLVGMRGKRIGDAQIGTMHSNYFINLGNAKASEVIQLASMAKTRVRDKFGVQLKEEVQLVGF